ncbi:MAG: Uma2 family endonuclease [Microcystaceae cyanobacterium]
MQLELRQVHVPPGQQLLLKDINWQQFEAILSELGENRSSRLSYSQGTLEIMTPLLEHEKNKSILGSIVIFLLEELQMDYEPSASTTFKNENMKAGVEPDESFYIASRLSIMGKEKIDLTIDPPPDLAIEIDITSRTSLDNYEVLRVPELWRFKKEGMLEIYILREGKYVESSISPTFSYLTNLREMIIQCLQQSKTVGTSSALREFKTKVREQLSKLKQESDR